ncbi:micronuclear linker histone polyprotein-like [Mytilus edulis]|uniref:micronuclear linker histone polyprotein-like n=1 Tax=Mytilus edulis TaxID=6550 RepID=UPI0039EED00F
MSTISNFPVSASPHNSLNSCKGIIRDRSQYLGDLTVDEIGEELSSQGSSLSSPKKNVKKKSNKKETVEIHNWSGESVWDLPSDIDDSSTSKSLPSSASKKVSSSSSKQSTRAPSPLRSQEKKDVQKKPGNTSSQKSSDSRSRGRGRGGVTPAARSPGDRRLSSHNRFSTLIIETEMETESVPPPERSRSQELNIITKKNEKKKSNKKETVEIHNWSGESVWDLPTDIDDSSTSKSLPSSKKLTSSSSTKSTRAPSPLRSQEKKDFQKKPVNTSSQRSSDSRSRGRGRGGVKPAACGPGDRRLSSHNRFSTLVDETEMEIESVPPPERSQSQGERNKNAGKLDSIRPSIIK